MQLVAAAKMKKAQDAATGRPRLRRAAQQGARQPARQRRGGRPSLLRRSARATKTLVLLITTDKGLCGALNTNLFKKLSQRDIDPDAISSPSAARARSPSPALQAQPPRGFPGQATPPRSRDTRADREVPAWSKFLERRRRQGAASPSHNFVNTAHAGARRSSSCCRSIPSTLGGKRSFEASARRRRAAGHAASAANTSSSPSPRAVLDGVLPHYVNYDDLSRCCSKPAPPSTARAWSR